MGASFIDYILVDDYIVPSDQQPFFTEKLVHLPGCYQVNDSQREIASRTPSRAECGLPEAGFVFCSFNNNFKITPEMFGVWMELLKEVPGSVLWLLEGNRFAPANLCREAEEAGSGGGKVSVCARIDHWPSTWRGIDWRTCSWTPFRTMPIQLPAMPCGRAVRC